MNQTKEPVAFEIDIKEHSNTGSPDKPTNKVQERLMKRLSSSDEKMSPEPNEKVQKARKHRKEELDNKIKAL